MRVREGERKKAERCLVDTHREHYEVTRRRLRSHASHEYRVSLSILLSNTSPLLSRPPSRSRLFLSVLKSPFFFPFSWEQPATWLTASFRARNRTSSRRPPSAHAHVFSGGSLSHCAVTARHLIGAAIGCSVIFQRRVSGKEWRATDWLPISYFSNLKENEWASGGRVDGGGEVERLIEKVKEGRQ